MKIRQVLLLGLLGFFATVGLADDKSINQALAPKLVEAIEDQTLFLDSKFRDRDGPVGQNRFYWRDLRRSFKNTKSQGFSAFPYNKDVADAWIVDNYLIVLGKSAGSVQVAVTASNQYGSMIDWFIVHVEEQPVSGDGSGFKTAFEYELSTTYASREVDLYLRLPPLDDPDAAYGIVPNLPQGVNFDADRKFIYGRLTGEASVHYWVGIASNESPHIQRFTLEPLISNQSVTPSSLVSRPITTVDSIRPVGPISAYTDVSDFYSFDQPASKDGFAVSASRPSQSIEGASFTNQFDFLYAITNAMHARQRNLTPIDTEPLQRNQTHWSYASSATAYVQQSGPELRRKLEPSGIYVGIDSQVNQHFGSGLTLGYKSIVTADNRSASFFDTDQSTAGSFASMMPYASWQDEAGSSVWGVFGVMRDPTMLVNSRNSSRTSTYSQDLVLGVMGWRQALGSAENVQLSTIGDVGMVLPLRSSLFGESAADLLEAGWRRVSAGLEMSFNQDTQLQPYVGVTRHSNTNPLASITALEALGGFRYATFGGLTVEAEGRALAANDVFEDTDLLLSVVAHLDPGLRGEGFAFSVSPVYGLTNTPFVSTANLFVPYAQPYRQRSPSYRYTRDWMMSGSLSYGLPIGSSIVTPFGQIAVSTLNETRMGVRVALDSEMDRLFNLEIATVKSRFQRQAVDKGIDIQLRFVF